MVVVSCPMAREGKGKKGLDGAAVVDGQNKRRRKKGKLAGPRPFNIAEQQNGVISKFEKPELFCGVVKHFGLHLHGRLTHVPDIGGGGRGT